MKTSTGLVEYARAQLGRPYWFGTFGQTSSEKLWNDKAKQYPKYYSDTRKKKAVPAQCGKKVHDCAGLIKGYMWSAGPDAPAVYKADQDWSADTMYTRATIKGPISTIPERPGVLVWRKGHIGVYIGGGKVIEAKGFDYGVIESNLKGSTFTHWLEYSLITYEKGTEKPQEAPQSATGATTYTVAKGDTLGAISKRYGVTVAQLQQWNNIKDANVIRVGQVLQIRQPAGTPAQAPAYTLHRVNTNGGTLRIREKATTDSRVLGELRNGTEIKVASIANGWAKLYDRAGYVSANYISK